MLLEPLAQLLLVARLGREVHRLGLLEHVAEDEDRRLGAQGQRDRVARARVDFERRARRRAGGCRAKKVFSRGRRSRPAAPRASTCVEERAQQVVGHRPRRSRRLRAAARWRWPRRRRSRSAAELAGLVAQDDDRDVRGRVEHQPLDLHADFLARVRSSRPLWGCAAEPPSERAALERALCRGGASRCPARLCGRARVMRTSRERARSRRRAAPAAKCTIRWQGVRPASMPASRPQPVTSTSQLAAHELVVELALDLVLQREEPLQALRGDARRHPAVEPRRGGAGPRRVLEGEDAGEAHLVEERRAWPRSPPRSRRGSRR